MGIIDKFFKRSYQNSNGVDIKKVNQDKFVEYIFQEGYQPLNKNPDVIIAVDKIAELVSSMTIQLMENTEKGDVRIKDELAKKIDVAPCKYMTRKSWLYKIVKDLLLDGRGNSILHIEYDTKNDIIKNLTPFPMKSVDIIPNGNDYYIKYNGIKYSPDEVVHFAINPDTDEPYKGTGYEVVLKDIVQNLNQATLTKRSFMNGRNMPSLIIKVDANNDELSSKEGRKKIYGKYLETEQAGEPWIIPAELLEVQQIKPLTLNDIAINESVTLDKQTVASVIGVPPFFLGIGSFNKEEYNNFVSTKIMSIAQTIAQTLTRDILISPNRYFKLNPRSLYSYNLTEMVDAGSKMIQLAAMRRNELRDWVGMIPDEEMEEIIVLENYLPQEKLGSQKKLLEGGDENE